MADFDIAGNDAALKFETHANLNINIDEDLINYDSDDAIGMDISLGYSTNTADTQIPDAKYTVTDAALTLTDASEPVTISQGDAPMSGAASMEVGESGKRETHSAGEKLQDYEILDDFALEGASTAEQAPATSGVDHARGSIHEIDYEDDGFTFDAPTEGRTQQPLATSPGNPKSSAAPTPQAPESPVTKAPAKHYEIDWEDDDENDSYNGAQDGAAQGGTEGTAADAFADNSEEQERFDSEVQATEAEDLGTAQELAQELFPAITVQYRGEEFPLFSLSSDGFFSDVSILDESMKAVLDGLRAELAAEIGPHDDLVFQVDKLGLEFSEVCGTLFAICEATLTLMQSSPSDALTEITLRQMLEILDILVKNKDFDNSRILHTYLFTRPNTMKRYEFLVESATGDKGLAEVMHLFQPPSQDDTPGATGSHDGHGDQVDDYGSTEDDVAAHISHENSEAYENVALPEGGYDNTDDYQDEHDTCGDKGPDDASTGERANAADDEEHTEYPGPADPESAFSHDVGNIEYSIGDADDDAGHGDITEIFVPVSTAIDTEEHLLDTTVGGHGTHAQTNDESAHDLGRPGGERLYDHHLDPDLIDYSSAGDKNVDDDDDVVADLPNVGTSLGDEATKYGAVDNKATADAEDLIDYESVGDDNEGAQHGVGEVSQTSGEDVRGNEDEESANFDDGRHIESAAIPNDYSGDWSVYSQGSTQDEKADNEPMATALMTDTLLLTTHWRTQKSNMMMKSLERSHR